MTILSDEDVGLGPAAPARRDPLLTIAPAVQQQRDAEATRLRDAESKGGAGLVKTKDVIPGSKAGGVLSDEDVGLVAPTAPSDEKGFWPSFKKAWGISSVSDYGKALSNENLLARLKQAYDNGSLGGIVDKLSSAEQGPSRKGVIAETEGGAVTGRTQPRSRRIEAKRPSFEAVIEEAKKDPGAFFGHLARAAAVDPELLLLPAAVGIGAKAALGTKVIGAGATGSAVNMGVTAAQQLGEHGKLDGKAIEQSGALGFGMGAPFGLLGRWNKTPQQPTPRAPKAGDFYQGPQGPTDPRTDPRAGRDQSRPFDIQESGEDILKQYNLDTKAGDDLRNATLEAYQLIQSGAPLPRVQAAPKLVRQELDRLMAERQEAIDALKHTFQGEVLEPEAPRVGPQLESPGSTVTDDYRPLAPVDRPGTPPAGPDLGDSPLAAPVARLLSAPEEAQKLLPDQRKPIIQEASRQKQALDQEVQRLQEELAEVQTMSGRGSSAKTQDLEGQLKVAQVKQRNWQATLDLMNGLPDWAKTLGIGAAAYTGARMTGQDAEDALALGAAALAVKAKGGMWHPKAKEVVRNALIGDIEVIRQIDRLRQEVNAPGARGLSAQRDVAMHDWSDRASQSYLNKHMGTETDPLRDVEIPFGEGTKKWGEVTDGLVSKRSFGAALASGELRSAPTSLLDAYTAGKIPAEEALWSIDPAHNQGELRARDHAQALKSYLSHVGDYLYQNVPPEKLGQYDLVRAVKETAENDKRVAKAMEKEAAEAGKDLPVHKEYPDGFKWVELKLPEKLTPEQAKSIGDLHPEFDDFPALRREGVPRYAPLDSAGKRVINTFTGESPLLSTKEEAWLAGQLAREGNQMGHCVGGYCEGVAAGESRIFSLRDPKGKSHVTVEVELDQIRGSRLLAELTGTEAGLLEKELQKAGYRLDPAGRWRTPDGTIASADEQAVLAKRVAPRLKQLELELPPSIAQIKGKQNRAPTATYLPYVQDFVKGGKWGEVGDLENTGLIPRDGLNQVEWPAVRQILGDRPFYTKEEVTAAVNEAKSPSSERGSVDPRLLFGLAGGALGALGGAYLAEDNPGWGALVGGVLGGVMPTKAFRHSASELARFADQGLGVLSTRIGNLSEPIKFRAREFERRILKDSHDYITRGDQFLFDLNKLPKDQKGKLERAILTGDAAKTRAVLKELGNESLSKGWEEIRGVLAELGTKLQQEGRIKPDRAEYFPRIVTNLDGLKKKIGAEHAAGLNEAIQLAEKKSLTSRGHGLSEVELSRVVNKYLTSPLPGGKPGYAKGRKIEEVTAELQPFYATPTESFHSYVRRAVEDLEKARFFGRDRVMISQDGTQHLNERASIGNLVAREAKAGKLTNEEVVQLRKLLEARFQAKEAPFGIVQDIKNLINAGLLGNVVSAATQLGDIGTAVALNGMKPTLEATIRRLTGKHQVDMRDFGLMDHISEEFVSTRKSAKALNSIFKWAGFSAVDRLGKDVVLGSALSKYQRLSQTDRGRAEIARKYGESLGDEMPQLLDDLQKKKRTDLVDSILFSELSDIQPITKIEMPEAYLNHPNARVVYMLKSFMLKQIDIARREGYNNIKKGNVARGTSQLAKFGLALGVAGATTGMIQDWILGREVDWEARDIPMNILKTFGWSEYVMERAKKEGYLGTAASVVFDPPYRVMEDAVKGDPKAVQYIPWVGKLYYNRAMGGAEKTDAARERAREKRESEE